MQMVAAVPAAVVRSCCMFTCMAQVFLHQRLPRRRSRGTSALQSMRPAVQTQMSERQLLRSFRLPLHALPMILTPLFSPMRHRTALPLAAMRALRVVLPVVLAAILMPLSQHQRRRLQVGLIRLGPLHLRLRVTVKLQRPLQRHLPQALLLRQQPAWLWIIMMSRSLRMIRMPRQPLCLLWQQLLPHLPVRHPSLPRNFEMVLQRLKRRPQCKPELMSALLGTSQPAMTRASC